MVFVVFRASENGAPLDLLEQVHTLTWCEDLNIATTYADKHPHRRPLLIVLCADPNDKADIKRLYKYLKDKKLAVVLRPNSLGGPNITKEMINEVNTIIRDLDFLGDFVSELGIVGAFKVVDRYGEVITEALMLLALMGTVMKKLPVTLICDGTHPTIRRVWDMLNRRERIPAYSKWSATEFGQKVVKEVEDALNGDTQYVDVWKGAPQGSDSAWHLTTGPYLEEVMGVKNSDLTSGKGGARLAVTSEVAMCVGLEYKTSTGLKFNMKKGGLIKLAEEGKILILVLVGDDDVKHYHIFIARELLKYVRSEGNAFDNHICLSSLPNCSNPSVVGAGLFQWAFKCDSAKAAAEVVVRLLAGTTAVAIISRLAKEEHPPGLNWAGADFQQLLVEQPQLGAFLKDTETSKGAFSERKAKLDALLNAGSAAELRIASLDALKYLEEHTNEDASTPLCLGVVRLKLHAPLKLNEPIGNQGYETAFYATLLVYEWLRSHGYLVRFPRDATAAESLEVLIGGKWVRIKVSGSRFKGRRNIHSFISGVERMPPGHGKLERYLYPRNSYDVLIMVSYVIIDDKPTVYRTFACSQTFAEKKLYAKGGGAGRLDFADFNADTYYNNATDESISMYGLAQFNISARNEVGALLALEGPRAVTPNGHNMRYMFKCEAYDCEGLLAKPRRVNLCDQCKAKESFLLSGEAGAERQRWCNRGGGSGHIAPLSSFEKNKTGRLLKRCKEH